MEKSKSTRLRFTYEDDLTLLREFLNINPIINVEGWDLIQNNMQISTGKHFLIKTLKQHIQLLIEAFLKKVEVDEIRSGIEEPYSEKAALLQEVSSLCEEHNYNFKQKKAKSDNKEQKIRLLGKVAREGCAIRNLELLDVACEETVTDQQPSTSVPVLPVDHEYVLCGNTADVEADIFDMDKENQEPVQEPNKVPTPLCSPIAVSTPFVLRTKVSNGTGNNTTLLGPVRTRKKRGEPLKKNALLYLNEKNDRENKIKMKELELEERKLAIEEKKNVLKEEELKLKNKEILIHEQEVKGRLELEKLKAQSEVEEKKTMLDLLKSQQQLINQLLQK